MYKILPRVFSLHEELFETSFVSHQKKIIEFCTKRHWQFADYIDILKYAIFQTEVLNVSLFGGIMGIDRIQIDLQKMLILLLGAQ